MGTRRICLVSGAAVLALTATASAGPIAVASAKLIVAPQTQIEPAAYLHRHSFRHYGWHHRRHYGGRHHRYYYAGGYYYEWNPGPVFVGRIPGVLTLPSVMATDNWPYYGYPYDPASGYYGPDYYL